MEMAQLLPEFPLLNSTREQSPEHSGTTHNMYNALMYVYERNITCSLTGRVSMTGNVYS